MNFDHRMTPLSRMCAASRCVCFRCGSHGRSPRRAPVQRLTAREIAKRMHEARIGAHRGREAA
jgi:hypothetical protein